MSNQLDHEWALLQVKNPPCTMCRHWEPRMIDDGIHESFVTCNLPYGNDMERDFSCFESTEAE